MQPQLKSFTHWLNESNEDSFAAIEQLWTIGVIDDVSFINFLSDNGIDPGRFFSPGNTIIDATTDDDVIQLSDLPEWRGAAGEWILLCTGGNSDEDLNLKFIFSNGATLQLYWNFFGPGGVIEYRYVISYKNNSWEFKLSPREEKRFVDHQINGWEYDGLLLYSLDQISQEINK